MLKKAYFVKNEKDILNYSYKDFQHLLEMIPRIRKKDSLPNDLISDFILGISKSKILIDFDWIEWEEGNEIIENEKFDYNSLSLISLCKLVTAIIQSEKYIDGGLRDYFEDGTILRVLEVIDGKFKQQMI